MPLPYPTTASSSNRPINKLTVPFKAMQGGHPDLVLMNVDLDGATSGLDCARVLFKRYGIPVLFISGNAEKARQGQDVALGYMPKPLSERAILSGVRAIEQMMRGQVPRHIPSGLQVFHAPPGPQARS